MLYFVQQLSIGVHISLNVTHAQKTIPSMSVKPVSGQEFKKKTKTCQLSSYNSVIPIVRLKPEIRLFRHFPKLHNIQKRLRIAPKSFIFSISGFFAKICQKHCIVEKTQDICPIEKKTQDICPIDIESNVLMKKKPRT